ncbi:10075_t:CDS:2, partial [Acaulospora morrowiae]
MPRKRKSSSKFVKESDEEFGSTSKDKDLETDPSESESDSYESKAKSRQNKKTRHVENDNEEATFKLSEKKRVTVRKFKNMLLIDFREHYKTPE